MRNPAAHQALMRFCRDALAHLREAVPQDQGLPLRPSRTYTFTDTGYLSQPVSKIDWEEVLRRYISDIASIPSYTPALERIQVDPKLRGRPLASEQPRLLLASLLLRFLSAQGTLDFEPQVFDTIYRETEDYFYEDTVEYRYLAPLTRFSMHPEELPLAPRLSIVRMPDEWMEEMLLEVAIPPEIQAQFQKAIAARYALVLYLDLRKEDDQETPYRLPDEQEHAIRHARQAVRHLCYALRLFQPGAVGCEQIIPRPTSWAPWTSHAVYSGGLPSTLGPTYELSDRQAAQFHKFWSAYRSSTVLEERRMALAIRRFNTAYRRGFPEDKLIDLTIALEALLLTGQDRRLGYRMSLRAAALLARSRDEARVVHRDIHTIYGVRSDIVHAKKKNKTPTRLWITAGARHGWVKQTLSLKDFAFGAEDYVRRVIRQYLLRADSLGLDDPASRIDRVIEVLDRRIARGVTPQSTSKAAPVSETPEF
jgi:hypothetical protein